MKKNILKSFLAFSVLYITSLAYAEDTTVEQIGQFLCDVQLCRNDAVISKIEINKYNLPNLSEKLAGSGKQVLKLSFHQETPNHEYIRDYTDCNLVINSSTSMTLSSCKITGIVKVGRASRIHQLSLGEGEIIHQVEAGWMAADLKK